MGGSNRGVKAISKTSIEITFFYRGERCRERIKGKPTPANLIKAERFRTEILDSIEKDTFDYATTFPNSKSIAKFNGDKPRQITVKKYLLEWLSEKEPTIKSSTFTGYKKIITILNQQFGGIFLHELNRLTVYQWAKTLKCSNKRISNLLSPLRSALNDAVQNQLIQTNPIKDWHYKRIEPPKKPDLDKFTKDEQALILEALEGQGKNLIQFALWTGLRTSELIALEWGDIDWNRGTIKVQRALTQSATKVETTKTTAGEREVKLLAPAVAALVQQKQYTYLEGSIIFFNPRTNEPWQGDQAIRRTLWTYALKKAGVRYRRPYQTRHTYASMMLTAGEPLAWVSNQLGHSNVLVTAKIYAEWIPDSRPEVGNKAVDLFGNSSV